jgi:hypothetical protein
MYSFNNNPRQPQPEVVIGMAISIAMKGYPAGNAIVTAEGESAPIDYTELARYIPAKFKGVDGKKEWTREAAITQVRAKYGEASYPVVSDGRHRAAGSMVACACFGVDTEWPSVAISAKEGEVLAHTGNLSSEMMARLRRDEQLTAVAECIRLRYYRKQSDVPATSYGKRQTLWARGYLLRQVGAGEGGELIKLILATSNEDCRKISKADPDHRIAMLRKAAKGAGNAEKVMSGKDLREFRALLDKREGISMDLLNVLDAIIGDDRASLEEAFGMEPSEGSEGDEE